MFDNKTLFQCYDSNQNNVSSNCLEDRDIDNFAKIKIGEQFQEVPHHLDKENAWQKEKSNEIDSEKILAMSTEEFLKWHFYEIKEILDIIQEYKNPATTFEFPQPPFENLEINAADHEITNEELEKILKAIFIRSISLFSFQFFNEISNSSVKKAMFSVCSVQKKYLGAITDEIDKRGLRLLYNKTNERLSDFLFYPRHYFENILEYEISQDLGEYTRCL
uniref:Uncharacterized protein n=1 Tax=Strongyloides stercoralis TaxID=6248 RepID=A0A0K0E5N1_STRER